MEKALGFAGYMAVWDEDEWKDYPTRKALARRRPLGRQVTERVRFPRPSLRVVLAAVALLLL